MLILTFKSALLLTCSFINFKLKVIQSYHENSEKGIIQFVLMPVILLKLFIFYQGIKSCITYFIVTKSEKPKSILCSIQHIEIQLERIIENIHYWNISYIMYHTYDISIEKQKILLSISLGRYSKK